MSDVNVETNEENVEYTVLFSIEEFLKEYEKFPCLWDKNHVHFRDKLERLKCEEKLCEMFDVPDLLFLRRKIRSIRGSYNNEIRKIKQNVERALIEYPPKLSWFPLADKFLRVTTDLSYDVFPLVQIDDVDRFLCDDDQVNLSSAIKQKKGLFHLIINPQSKRQKLNCEGDYQEEVLQDYENTDYEQYEKLESFVQDECEDLKQDIEDFDQTEHLEIASTIPEQSEQKTSSDLSAIATCLKTLTKSSENEFSAFGQWLALQLQSMPLDLALQMQMDIQAHLTKSRLKYLQEKKNS